MFKWCQRLRWHPCKRYNFCSGPLAQLVEQLTLNQLVLGSSPSAPTNEFKHLGQFSRTGLFCFWAFGYELGTNAKRRPFPTPCGRPRWSGRDLGSLVGSASGLQRDRFAVRPCSGGCEAAPPDTPEPPPAGARDCGDVVSPAGHLRWSVARIGSAALKRSIPWIPG